DLLDDVGQGDVSHRRSPTKTPSVDASRGVAHQPTIPVDIPWRTNRCPRVAVGLPALACDRSVCYYRTPRRVRNRSGSTTTTRYPQAAASVLPLEGPHLRSATAWGISVLAVTALAITSHSSAVQ